MNFFVLARMVESEPGVIIRPIANAFGFLLSFLFDFVYMFGPAHSLGITIILMTIIFRLCVLPLNIRAQKSMKRMRALQPELNKIEAKYGNSRDPEIMKKKNAEKQILLQKHDANPLKSCFPMLLQMPLFFGVNFIMRQAFLYINRLRDLYYDLAVAVQEVPNFTNLFLERHVQYLPNAMLRNRDAAIEAFNRGMSIEAVRDYVGDIIDPNVPMDVARVLNCFSTESWYWLQESVPTTYWTAIAELNERRFAIESFLGLSMVERSGLVWPTIILPLLTVITMFLAQWLSSARMSDPNADEKTKMQQKIMIVVMPLMIGFFTITLPGGVALFWITSQCFEIIVSLIWNKKEGIKMRLPFSRQEEI